MRVPLGSKIKFETNFGPRTGQVLSLLPDGNYKVEAKVLEDLKIFHVHPDCILWWSERKEPALPVHQPRKKRVSHGSTKGLSVAEMMRKIKFSDDQEAA
jgi:hypothetical protein